MSEQKAPVLKCDEAYHLSASGDAADVADLRGGMERADSIQHL